MPGRLMRWLWGPLLVKANRASLRRLSTSVCLGSLVFPGTDYLATSLVRSEMSVVCKAGGMHELKRIDENSNLGVKNVH